MERVLRVEIAKDVAKTANKQKRKSITAFPKASWVPALELLKRPYFMAVIPTGPGGIAKTMPKIMPNRDRIVIGSDIWKIVALKELNPSNSTGDAILFELYLKR